MKKVIWLFLGLSFVIATTASSEQALGLPITFRCLYIFEQEECDLKTDGACFWNMNTNRCEMAGSWIRLDEEDTKNID